MTIITESVEIDAVQRGNSWFWGFSRASLAAGASINICVDVDEADLFLRSLILSSDSEAMEWQMYLNHAPNQGTGTQATINSRNVSAATKLFFSSIEDPTFSEPGDPLFPAPRIILGQAALFSAAYMYQELLTGGYIIPTKGSCRFEFTNASGAAAQVTTLFSGRKDFPQR